MTLAIAYNRDQFYTVAAALGGFEALLRAAEHLESAGVGGEGLAAIRPRLAALEPDLAGLMGRLPSLPTPLHALREITAGRPVAGMREPRVLARDLRRFVALGQAAVKEWNVPEDGAIPAIGALLAGQAGALPVAWERNELVKIAVGFTDFVGYSTMQKMLTEKHGQRRGKEMLAARVQQVFVELGPVIERMGGTVDKLIGDAIMFRFEDFTDNAARAVETALGLQEALQRFNDRLPPDDEIRFKMRVGVDTGEVVRGWFAAGSYSARTVIGDAVNTAARLESGSKDASRGILISKAVSDELGGLFKLKPWDHRLVAKGVGEIDVQEVLDRVPRWQVQEKRELQAPFMGRVREFQAIRRRFERAVSENRPTFVEVEAREAGAGKTRLVESFLKWLGQTQPNVEVIRASGENMPAIEPYSILVEALRDRALIKPEDDLRMQQLKVRQLVREATTQMNPERMERDSQVLGHFLGVAFDLPEETRRLLEDPEENRSLRYESFTNLFAGLAHRNPLILYLDDRQWIDIGTQRVVEALLTRLEGSRLMVLTTHRPEGEAQVGAPDWFAATAKPFETERIVLEPLSESDLGKIVDRMMGEHLSPGARSFLIQRSGGNPFLLERLLRSIKQDNWELRQTDPTQDAWDLFSPDGQAVPAEVREFLQAQVNRLPDDDLDLLRRVSVIGSDFGRDELTALGFGIVTASLDRLVHGDYLVKAGEDRYTFGHDLLRSGVYERLVARDRSALHSRFADYLIAVSPTDYARIASHLERAGRNAEAANYYYKAAEAAAAQEATVSAGGFYRRAFELETDTQKKFKYLWAWDKVLFDGRAYEGQDEVHSLAVQLLGSLPLDERNPADVAGVGMRWSRALLRRRDRRQWLSTAENELGQALAIAEEGGLSKLKVSILDALGLLYDRKGDLEHAKRKYEEAVAAGKAIRDDLLTAQALLGLRFIHAKQGNYSGDLEGAREALRLFQRVGGAEGRRGIIISSISIGSNLLSLGAYGEAHQILSDTEILTGGRKGRNREPLYFNLGRLAHLQGRFDEAIQRFEEQIKAKPDATYQGLGLVYLSLAYLDGNLIEKASMSVEEALSLAMSMNNEPVKGMVYMVKAKLAASNGDVAQAIAESEKAIKILTDCRSIEEFDLEIERDHAQYLIAAGRETEAAPIIKRAWEERLQPRATQIKEENYRESLLANVVTNRDIFILYQKLSAYQSADIPLQQFLSHVKFSPTATLPPPLTFVDRTRVGFMNKHSRDGGSTAGIVLNVPLLDAVKLLVSSTITIPENRGVIDAVWAKDIKWKPFLGADGNVYATLDWDLATEYPRLGSWILKFGGMNGHHQELLRGELRSLKDGSVSLEFRQHEGTSVKVAGGETIALNPKAARPRGDAEFGVLTFTFNQGTDGKTTVGLDMAHALFTENPWNFLQALANALG